MADWLPALAQAGSENVTHPQSAATIDPLRFYLRPVLHWLAPPGWKCPFAHLSALWTGFDLCLMRGHFHTHRRQIKHMAPFTPLGGHIRQAVLAVRTTLHAMHSRPGSTRLCNGAQRRRMAGCSSFRSGRRNTSTSLFCTILTNCTSADLSAGFYG